jgi:hypothetical protein
MTASAKLELHSLPPERINKFDAREARALDSGKATRVQAEISPDVRALIDNVLIPILVRDFLDILRSEKQLAMPKHHVSAYDLPNAAPPKGKVTI